MKQFASAALLASASLFAFQAHAQDVNDPPGADLYAEDEIIVTATRRAESIQDVPIAVTAITPGQLERQGIVNIQDLSAVTPGFNIQSSQTETQGTSLRIRGVGTTGNNIGLESAVGIFIDGVYQSRPGVALSELVDVESIEILRGPQGTLFGRNVTAGALNIRTVAPQIGVTEGFANFTYGNYDLLNLQGGINVPAGDSLAFRATGSVRKRDGFLESTIVPDGESHDRDRFLLRGQALWEPTDATSLRLIADYNEVDEQCCAATTLTISPNLSPASAARFFPEVGFDALDDQLFNDQVFTNGLEQWSVSGELVHDFGAAELTGILGYTDFRSSSRQNEFNGGLVYTVNGPTVPGDEVSYDDIETLTAELRLQGEAFDGRLDWLVGGFYADEKIEELFALGLGPDYSAFVTEANLPSPIPPSFLSLYAGAGNYLLQLQGGAPSPTFAPLSADGQFASNLFNQEAESFSVFTHNIIEVTDALDLTLGVRYVDDTKDGRFDQPASGGNSCLASSVLLGTASAAGAGDPAAQAALGALAGATGPQVFGLVTNPALLGTGAFLNCFPFAAPAIGTGRIPDAFAAFGFLPELYDDTFEDDELIYTASLSYDISPDVLLYGGFTHGYKAGGFNLDASAGAGGADPRFLSEEIDSWEAGLKTTLADGRLRFNVTGFWSTMDNFQVLEFTGTRFETFNVQDVSSKGVELELNGRLSPNVLINAGLTYADAGYGDDCNINTDGTVIPQALGLCGESLTNAPELTSVLGVTYDGDLGDSGWGLLANVNLESSSERRTSTRPFVVSGGQIVGRTPLDDQSGYSKLNARLGFQTPNDMATVEFWALNITDVITRGITFNTPLAGASRSAFSDAPRTYGVTLRTKFGGE